MSRKSSRFFTNLTLCIALLLQIASPVFASAGALSEPEIGTAAAELSAPISALLSENHSPNFAAQSKGALEASRAYFPRVDNGTDVYLAAYIAPTVEPTIEHAPLDAFGKTEVNEPNQAPRTDAPPAPIRQDEPASPLPRSYLPIVTAAVEDSTRSQDATVEAAEMNWAVGNVIGLNCGTEIREGSNLSYPVHTTVPVDDYQVLIQNGPRFEDGQTWWDINRQAISGDPNDGTGWVSQQQAEGAFCDGGGNPVIWEVGVVLGVCAGTEIRHGPELAIHTVVPENEWEVFIVDGPRIVNGQTWWDTSRELAGDPSGGTGWINQEQAAAACTAGGSSISYIGPLPLSPELRALLWQMGYRHFQEMGADPVNMANGNFVQQATDLSVPGVAGFDLIIERTYNSQDPRDSVFGTGWTSWLDANLRIANDATIDVRYPDGHSAHFVLNGDVYEPGQAGVFDELRYVDPGFELVTVDQMTYEFDQQGYLTAYRDRHGNTISLERDDEHRITRIVDSAGRIFPMTYDGEHITSITDPVGRVLTYAYADNNLVAFTDGNQGVHRYAYDGEQQMTALTDPEGILYLQNVYDAEGRVIEQVDAADSHSYIAYGSDGITTLTDNLGNQTHYFHDEFNRVVQVEDALGQSIYYTYDDSYNRTSMRDKNGNLWTYTYDERGNLLIATDPLGQTEVNAYSGANDRISVVDELGRETRYDYNGAGNLLAIKYADGATIIASYDAQGQMLTRTDENGHTSNFAYDGQGNLSQVSDPLGHVTRYDYDGVGRMAQITDANGHTARFDYDGNDNITRIVDPKNQATNFAYDLNDNLVRMTDRRGGVTAYEYDVNLKLIAETDPEGHTTHYAYDLMYNRIATTDARGNVTTYGYDAVYQLTSMEDALGNGTTFDYDANSNVIAVIDALSQVTAYEYDALDRLTRMTDALGGVTTYAYDAVGQRINATNPRGASTDYAYDLRDRLVSTTDALGGVWTTTYDAVGNVLSTTDANGHATTFAYDAANRLTREADAEGHATVYDYDGVGNVVRVTNARGFVTAFAYDENDNVIAVTDALNGVTSFAYDAEDNLVGMTDPDGHTTTYSYDLDDQLTAQIDAENQATEYAYDAAHNLVSMTNANGQSWRYQYDALNRPIGQTDTLNQMQAYAYDALGRQSAVTDENGIVTRFEYDALDRLTGQTANAQSGVAPDAATNVVTRFTYDAVGNLLSETDGNGHTTLYAYDLLDRLIRSENAEAEVTAFAYDAVGNLVALTNPRGYLTRFAYNSDDLLINVTDALLGETVFSYDAAHNRTDTRDANGIVTHSEYDALDRLTAEISNYQPGVTPDAETNVTTAYSYNADSTLAALTDPNGNVSRFTYDGIHRLTTEADALAGVTRYEYDAVSNLLALIDANNHRTSYAYDALNRQVAMTDPEGHQEAYAYDAVGNLTQLVNGRGFATEFAYDNLYRMVQMTDARGGIVRANHDAVGNVLSITDQNGHTQSLAYDKVNRLLSHTDAEGYSTAFAYDENGNRIGLTDGNGHLTTYAYDKLDRLTLATNAENEPTAFAYDPVGNRVAMVEADGVVTRYEFDPIYRLAGVIQNDRPDVQPDHVTNVRYGYSYDANGNLTAITDPLAHVTRFQYDALDRLVQETNPLDNVWLYGYDPVGNLTTRLDANGALTEYGYTADDLLARIAYPDGTAITYDYDANHNLVAMVDSLGSSSWTFDELDRLVTAVDAHNRALNYAYDAVGNRTTVTYPDGNTAAYSYLANDWLQRMDLPDGQWAEYARDGVGLTTGIVNSNSTVTEQSYDRANRMLSTVTRQTSGAQKMVSSFQYTLDDVGQRVQTVAEYGLRNPPVVTTAYSYDPLRRLVRSTTDEGVWTEYDFDAAGNRLALRTNDDALSPRPFDAQTLSYTYNDANQLLSVLDETGYTNGKAQKSVEKVAQALQALRHEIEAQRGKHISDAAADALIANIDDLLADLYGNKPPKSNQIAAALDALANQVDAYLASGDIAGQGIANSLSAKLATATQANSGSGNSMGDLQAWLYTYDANGNRINETWPGPQGPPIQGTDYAYSYENRLIQALAYQGNPAGNRVDRGVTTMAYDGLFRRLSKSFDPKQGGGGVKVTDTLFDGLDPVAEYDLWNGQYADFYRGDLNRMVAMQAYPSSQMHWYAYDGLGSVTGLTRADGQSVHNYRYTDYGLVTPVSGNWTEPHNHYTFTGQPWDVETELLHFYARDYDPVTGVWMQQDAYRGQLAEPMTLHRYGYVGNSPVDNIDKLGFVSVEPGGTYGSGEISVDGEMISVYIPPVYGYDRHNNRVESPECPAGQQCLSQAPAYYSNIQPDECMFQPCIRSTPYTINPPVEEGWETVSVFQDTDNRLGQAMAFNEAMGGDGISAENMVEMKDYRGQPLTSARATSLATGAEFVSRTNSAMEAYRRGTFIQFVVVQERAENESIRCTIDGVDRRAIIVSTNLNKSATFYQGASIVDFQRIAFPYTVESKKFLLWRYLEYRDYRSGDLLKRVPQVTNSNE